ETLSDKFPGPDPRRQPAAGSAGAPHGTGCRARPAPRPRTPATLRVNPGGAAFIPAVARPNTCASAAGPLRGGRCKRGRHKYAAEHQYSPVAQRGRGTRPREDNARTHSCEIPSTAFAGGSLSTVRSKPVPVPLSLYRGTAYARTRAANLPPGRRIVRSAMRSREPRRGSDLDG